MGGCLMNRILKKFLQRGVDLSPVGVELREDNTKYFCTPKGASVFGWAGIDGIHFCFIRGFGEMVFSVSPMNTSPDYVHPVAENFTDFLRLILACGDVAAVEQAWMWNEAQFEAFLNENPTTQEHIQERHRHRYEFNNDYKDRYEAAGMKCVGINPESDLVEIVEIPTLKWFVGTQFHPEYGSTVLNPHPLFVAFVKAAIENEKATVNG